MTFLYTLKLTGIQGESEIENHQDEINVDQIVQEYHAPNEMDAISNISVADIQPAIICQGVTVIKKYDKSIPNLLTSLIKGEEIEKGSISCFGENNQVFLTIDLKRIVIRRTKITLEQDFTKIEVNFTYGEISHSFTPDGTRKAIFNYQKVLN